MTHLFTNYENTRENQSKEKAPEEEYPKEREADLNQKQTRSKETLADVKHEDNTYGGSDVTTKTRPKLRPNQIFHSDTVANMEMMIEKGPGGYSCNNCRSKYRIKNQRT